MWRTSLWLWVGGGSGVNWELEIDIYVLWCGLARWRGGKDLPASAGVAGLIPGLGKSPGRGNGNPLQYSYQKNPMVRGAWWATVHGVTSQLGLTRPCTHTHTTMYIIDN